MILVDYMCCYTYDGKLYKDGYTIGYVITHSMFITPKEDGVLRKNKNTGGVKKL